MKKNIVDIGDGRVFAAYVEQPAPSQYNANPLQRFYFDRELTTKGVPDRRSRGHTLGVRIDYQENLAGHYAIDNEAVAVQAQDIRREIARLGNALHAAKQSLLALYK